MQTDAAEKDGARKKKSKGARLSKAEREARREARQAAASADEQQGDAFASRRSALLGHVAAGDWDRAAALGGESLPLAIEFIGGQLLRLARPRQVTHFGRRVAQTVPVAALEPLVQQAAAAGLFESAAALARGLGATERIDMPELVLRALEARGLSDAVRELVVGDGALQLATLRRMLTDSRCLAHAAHFLPSLQQLPIPGTGTCAALGSQAEAELLAFGGGFGMSGSVGAPAAEAPAVEVARAAVETALRGAWPDARVLVFGSARLGTAHAASDVDLCAVLPSVAAHAHPRSKPGREALLPILRRAEALVRQRCGAPPAGAATAAGSGTGGGDGGGGIAVADIEVLNEAKVPLLAFRCEVRGGASRAATFSVELSFNNSDGVANCHVMGALMARAPPVRLACRFARLWARRQQLCGPHGTPSAWTWSVVVAHAAQQAGMLPLARPSSDAFAALLCQPSVGSGGEGSGEGGGGEDAAWRQLAASSLGDAPVRVSSIADILRGASVASPAASPVASPTPAGDGASAAEPMDAAAASAAVEAAGCGALLWSTYMLLASGHSYRRRVVSLRDAETTKQRKGWSRRNEAALMVEDPIETERDLARLVSGSAVHATRLAAARAVLAMADGAEGDGGGGGGDGGSMAALLLPSDWRLDEHRAVLGEVRIAAYATEVEQLRAAGTGEVSVVADAAAGAAMVAELEASLTQTPVLAVSHRAAPLPLPPLVLGAASRDVGCEGGGGGERGGASWLFVVSAHRAYAIDLRCADGTALVGCLAPLLQSPGVVKITHDCRMMADDLRRGHGVGGIRPVFDVQLAHAVLRRQAAGAAAASAPADVLATRGECAALSQLHRRFLGEHGQRVPRSAESAADWGLRPPPTHLLREAAREAALLLPLHARLRLELELLAAPPASATPAATTDATSGGSAAAAELARLEGAVAAGSAAYVEAGAAEAALPSDAPPRMHEARAGVVANVTAHGVFVRLGGGVHGLIAPAELHGAAAPSLAVADDSADAVVRAAPRPPWLPHVAERVTVRVVGIEQGGSIGAGGASSGALRVSLSQHGGRLNPSLDSASQLLAGDVLWGRLLDVDAARAIVSVELPHTAVLRAANVQSAASTADLRTLLSVGDLLRVRVLRVQSAGGGGGGDGDGGPPQVLLAATISGQEGAAAAAAAAAVAAAPAIAMASGGMASPSPSDDAETEAPMAGVKRSWESESEDTDTEEEGAGGKRRRRHDSNP